MFCRFCGAQLNDNALFCKNCGSEVKKNNADIITYEEMSFKQEFKKSILLFVLPFIVILWTFVRAYVYRNYPFEGDLLNIVGYANPFMFSIFWGSLAYVCMKRSIKFSWLFLIPYTILTIFLVYPLAYNVSIDFSNLSNSVIFRDLIYFGEMFLPFLILGVLRLAKRLMKDTKSRIEKSVVAALITVVIYSFFIAIYYLIEFSGSEYAVKWALEAVLYESIGIIVVNLLLNIVYKAK